jgi:hypothetical protein
MSGSGERKVPSFLGIGAARAGTTWLHANLRRHPQIWLPPLKELHYFDLQRRGAGAYYPISSTDVRWCGRNWKLTAGGLGRLWYYRHFFKLLCRLSAGRAPFRWSMRYILGSRSDRWYASLFRTDCVSGEISPGYMLLPQSIVEEVRRLNPDMKIIFLLRNPVSRAWSNLRYRMGQSVLTATDDVILNKMESPGSVLRSRYVQAVKIWRDVFGPDQVFIGFFDDLVAAPRELLRSVLNFLGVDSSDANMPATLEREVNASAKRDLPEHLLPRLYASYLDDLRELEKLVGGPVSKWLAKAEEAVARDSTVLVSS